MHGVHDIFYHSSVRITFIKHCAEPVSPIVRLAVMSFVPILCDERKLPVSRNDTFSLDGTKRSGHITHWMDVMCDVMDTEIEIVVAESHLTGCLSLWYQLLSIIFDTRLKIAWRFVFFIYWIYTAVAVFRVHQNEPRETSVDMTSCRTVTHPRPPTGKSYILQRYILQPWAPISILFLMKLEYTRMLLRPYGSIQSKSHKTINNEYTTRCNTISWRKCTQHGRWFRAVTRCRPKRKTYVICYAIAWVWVWYKVLSFDLNKSLT